MACSPALFSSILNIASSRNPIIDVGFPRIAHGIGKKQSTMVPVAAPSMACNSSTITNSLTLDYDSVSDGELKTAESRIGSKIRVKGPLKVFHVPKVPEFELGGKIGVLKQYVASYKGKRISANLPYQVEFVADDIIGRNGKPVKFIAHLREDEFELLD